MKIIPNFIEDRGVQQRIKNTLLDSNNFGYTYKDHVGSLNDKSDFYFLHTLFSSPFDGGQTQISQSFNEILSPLIGRFNFNYLIRGKVNMYTRKPEFIKTEMHTDYPIEHMVALYSVNTNNGYTLFEDGTKVDSVENQIVIFHGSKKHCSVAQTDTNVRVNVNINFT